MVQLGSVRSPLVVGLFLLTAGCGASRPLPVWVPDTYHYLATLPGTGAVSGSIVVIAEGPLNLSSSVGTCEPRFETTPSRLRERADGLLLARGFVCGTDYRISVALGHEGGPPIEGSISNQRADTVTTYGETTCAQYQTKDDGERVCVAWNWGPKREVRTIGATVRWDLVTGSVAPGP